MLPAEVVAFAGLLGLAVGSMLNVAIDRLPKGESIVTVPSHCEACGHRLAPLDLVPVISFLLLRGRCRYCGARIPGRIPLVELTTGILFSFIAWRYGAVPESPVLMAFVGFIIVVFVVDLRHLLILDKVTYPGMVLALLVVPWGPAGRDLAVQGAYLNALIGVLLGGGVLSLVFLFARGGFGFGDVKLGVLLGLMSGAVPVLVALQLAFVVGGLVALVLLLLKGRGRRDFVPFGPFLAGAGIVALFWGQDIFDWYQRVLP